MTCDLVQAIRACTTPPVVRERSLTNGGERAGKCWGREGAIFWAPIWCGPLFFGPRLAEGDNFWAPSNKTLGDRCERTNKFCAINFLHCLNTVAVQDNLHRIAHSKLNHSDWLEMRSDIMPNRLLGFKMALKTARG